MEFAPTAPPELLGAPSAPRDHVRVRQLPGGTVTLLFTDIDGSTRLLHELGERYAEVLICRDFSDWQWAAIGATSRLVGVNRLRPGITGYSRRFVVERTGCDRLRRATTR